ncbi:hypothetical protein IV203_005740 [Nitzschia inconspicua]|uniref:Uncharacterized protein n=1 Tax=Nitzschia inconspicua TaxID=303405 RepID=A0A9K3KNN6_9STRA|nr:hypothetical protein IV203_005740 [Nitzschia inconspicua]
MWQGRNCHFFLSHPQPNSSHSQLSIDVQIAYHVTPSQRTIGRNFWKDEGVEETAIGVYWVTDCIDQCLVGFLPRHCMIFDMKKSTKEELLRLSSSSSHLKVHPHDEDPTGTEEYAWQLFYKRDLDDNI